MKSIYETHISASAIVTYVIIVIYTPMMFKIYDLQLYKPVINTSK